MQNTLSEIVSYLLSQSWQIGVVFVVVVAACWLLRKSSAHWRYLLWLIVLAKCLVPPILSVPVAVLPESAPPPSNLVAQTQPQTAVLGETPNLTAEAIETPIAEPVEIEPTRAPLANWPSLTREQWLGAAWMAGAAAFLLLCLFKAWRTQHRLSRTRRAANTDLQVEVAELAIRLALSRAPKIWLVDGISQPFVWGLFRGGIYLPANFEQVCQADDLRGILMHELAHVSRWDAAINALQVLVQGAFFFHPLVWWANRKIRQEREKCCDEVAIASLSAMPKQYGRAIVDILVNEYESSQPVPSLAVAGPVKNVEERIKTMMRPNKKFYKRPTWLAVISVLIVAVIAIPTALTLTARAAPEPEAAPVSTHPNFTATLSNGLKVELVGVSDHQNKNWWRPDGKSLESDLYQMGSKVYPKEDSQARGLAVRLSGKDAEGVGLTWQIPTATSSSYGSTIGKAGKVLREIHSLLFACSKNLDQIDVRLGIAFGPWQTKHNNSTDAPGISAQGGDKGGVVWHRANEKDGKTILIVAHSYNELNRRLVAIGKDNQLYTAASTGASVAGMATIQATFSVPLRKIREFQFQTRPYEWVEFRSVSLVPGKNTDVQVVVETPLRRKLIGWVERFFSQNYRDVKQRRAIEWGQPKKLANGNYSVRYKYECRIWDKERMIGNVVFTFKPDGTYVSAKKVAGYPQWPDRKTPATKPSETLTFGPVIERVINDVDETDADQLIDFESGNLSTLPKDTHPMSWMAERGIDALVDTTSKGAILGGYDFEAALVSTTRWDGIKPAEVQARLADGNPGVKTITRGRAKSYFIKPNDVFTFKTREGGMGILQIVGFTEKPKGVKIRYKMVQSAKPGEPLRNVLPSNFKPYNSDRFHQMRQILLGLTLYVQDQNGWPAKLTDLKPYLPNDASISLEQYIFKSPGKVLSVEGKRPVLFEKTPVRPDGQFVGFDDTHVEFVKDHQRLQALKSQAGLQAAQPATR